VVGLDVGEGLDVPGGGELKGAVDFIEAGDEVLIEGPGATGDQGVGDVTEVVADVTGALGLALGGGGVVGPLLLGGVGELVVDGLSSAVDEGVSVGGESLGGLKGVLGALVATEGGVELGVAQKPTLGVSGGNGLGEWSLGHGKEKRRGTGEKKGSADSSGSAIEVGADLRSEGGAVTGCDAVAVVDEAQGSVLHFADTFSN